MDYSKMEPPVVDNILVKAMAENAEAQAKYLTAEQHIKVFRDRIENYDQPYLKTGKNGEYYSRKVEETRGHLAEAEVTLAAAREAIVVSGTITREIGEEFDRRGGWSRYFLVLNTNGHVHTSVRCSTCFPSTQFAWLPDQAGLPAEALVLLAGESACTTCFPDAPVDALRRPNTLEAPERKAAKEKRAQERLERERVKEEKAITAPDGSVLRTGPSLTQRIRTASRAQRVLVSNLVDIMALEAGKYPVLNPEWRAEKERENEILLPALAHKFADRLASEGKTSEDLLKEYEVKANAKYKRDWK